MLTDSKRAGQGKLPYLALDSFIWVFSATILRPLTSARNYATIADRKSANSEGLITVVRMQKVQCDFIRSLAPLLLANSQNLV